GSWCDKPLFPAIIKKAGYHVDFLTNQFALQKDLDVHDFSGGFFLNSQKLSDKMFDCRNERRYTYDESLIAHYDTLRCGSHDNRFVIFHLMGQHFSYNKRYPTNRNHFRKEQYNRPDIKNQKNVRIVAMYDNATLYNDSVVCEIIKRFSNKDAIVIYLPDHGEEVFDEMQRFARCVWDNVTPAIARQEFCIPMMVWCSREYRRNHPDIVRQIRKARRRPFMTDDISHMLLYLAGIDCKEYSESRNLLSPSFDSSRKRMLRNKYDCDSLLSITK
ncbi:MAG: sulfatase-like hydrolase/transferase, partial [Bacteroidaceae bacterium]|nr:sulfatase-like hydrolase/transferase [Bacteroidaceae bacterium]